VQLLNIGFGFGASFSFFMLAKAVFSQINTGTEVLAATRQHNGTNLWVFAECGQPKGYGGPEFSGKRIVFAFTVQVDNTNLALFFDA